MMIATDSRLRSMKKDELIQYIRLLEMRNNKYKALYREGYSAQSRWIPVTKRLPECSEDVLVCYKDGEDYSICCGFLDMGAWYFDFSFYEYGDYVEIENVTHWMPLPEVPKEGE